MKVREVPVDDLRSLKQAPWADPKRRCLVSGDRALIPVKEGFAFDREVPERKPYQGRGFFLIGSTAVIRGRRPSDLELEELIHWCKPKCVLWVKSIRGIMRLPDTCVLMGTPGDVCHHENGVIYHLDPAKVMFAQGNLTERQRMAMTATLHPGERVADMCAGIGYFTIPMAVAGAFVHAIEINPVAFRYLERNISANCVQDRVVAERGDCRDLLREKYDRLILGHFSSVSMIGSALEHVHRGSVLHIHSIGPTPPDMTEKVVTSGLNADTNVRVVKKFGPGIWHFVQDLVIR